MAGIYDERIIGAKQQAETARKLREGITAPQGQMVSGWYVPPSITQYMANALKSYGAGKEEREAKSEYERMQKQKQTETADILRQLEPQASVQVSPEMANAAYGQGDINSVMANPTPQTQTTYQPVDERTRMAALLRGAAVNPEAFQPQMQMAQWDIGRQDKRDAQAATASERQAAREWQAQQAQMAREANFAQQESMVRLGKELSRATNTGKVEEYGKIQPGFRRVRDPATGEVMRDEAMPGSAPYQKLKGQYAQETAAVTNATADADNLIARADALIKHPGLPANFGVRSYIPNVRGTDAGSAETLLNELKDSMQLAGFSQLRSTSGSPGAMTEKEWPKLEAAISKLQNASNVEDAKTALGQIKIYAERIKNVSGNAYKTEWGGSQFDRETSAQPAGGMQTQPSGGMQPSAPGLSQPEQQELNQLRSRFGSR
jgi:hypothetical protein